MGGEALEDGMTVIAWDGKTLAADQQGEMQWIKTSRTKVHLLSGASHLAGCLVGGAGERWLVESMLVWLEGGADPEKYPQGMKDELATVLLIKPNGEAHLYMKGPHTSPIGNKFIAIGSGGEAAMAAMHLGCDARKAVEVAMAICTGCGGGIDTLALA